MAVRFFLVPIVGTGASHLSETPDPWRPKHTDDLTDLSELLPPMVPGGTQKKWRALGFGKEPHCLLQAAVTPAELALFTGDPACAVVPANLSNTIGNGAALTNARAALEARGIPGDILTAGMTWRVALRWVGGVAVLYQRFNGRYKARFFQLTENMDTLVSAIPPQRRQRLGDTARSLGLNPDGITGSMTIRQALRTLGEQSTRPIVFGGEAL